MAAPHINRILLIAPHPYFSTTKLCLPLGKSSTFWRLLLTVFVDLFDGPPNVAKIGSRPTTDFQLKTNLVSRSTSPTEQFFF
jgi:hypothetical protein